MFRTTLFALFLLCAFTLYPPSTTAEPEPVRDRYGNIARNGNTFFMLPVYRARGGGIALSTTGNETCSLSVVQSIPDASKGLPLIVSSPEPFGYILDNGTRVEIGFTPDVVPKCAPTPSEWTVVEGLPEGRAVKLTGYANTVRGAFSIHRVPVAGWSYSYKLLFCEFDNNGCGAVGLVWDDAVGVRVLAVTEDRPYFEFVLEQVPISSTAST